MEFIKCPVCQFSEFSEFISAVDYTVSRETFHIVECESCKFKLTNPRPTESEIGIYYESDAYISHSDSSAGLINKIYKAVRLISLKRKLKLINSFGTANKTLLDIGCGTGAFLNVMQLDHWSVCGIEPNENARTIAFNEYGLKIYPETHLRNITQKYDVVTLWHVLEHVHDLQSRLDEIKKVMTNETVLIVAVPNCESKDAAYYQQYWAAFDVPRHLYHFTPGSMANLMDNNGFKIIEKKTMPFDAFYVSMLSEKYRSNKQRLFNALKQGLISNLSSKSNVDTCSSIIYLIKLK